MLLFLSAEPVHNDWKYDFQVNSNQPTKVSKLYAFCSVEQFLFSF